MIWMKMNMANNPTVNQIKDKQKYGIFWVGSILADQLFFYGYPQVS